MLLQKIDTLPSHIKNKYQRIILITDTKPLQACDIDPDQDLIVTTNWLLWQRLVREERHCVHLDYGHVLSPIRELTENIFIESNDWLFKNGSDPSLFHGVSLGRKMLKEISAVIAEYERIYVALKAICKAFNAEQIVFIELRTVHDFLNREDRVFLVKKLADDIGCSFSEVSVDIDDAEFRGNENSYANKPDESKGKKHVPLTTIIFENACNICCRIFNLFRKKTHRVLLMHSQLTSIPLLAASDGQQSQPMMLSSWYPEKRNIPKLLKRLLSGLILIPSKEFNLSKGDLSIIDDIYSSTKSLVLDATTPRNVFLFQYIKNRILKRGYLQTLAKDVLYAEWLINTYHPDAVTCDGMQNTYIQNFLELAKRDGITTYSTWHACLVHNYRLEIFGCDPRIPKLIDTVLTWAVTDENWLSAIGAQSNYVRTGHILASNLRDIRNEKSTSAAKSSLNALVLQYVPQYDDFETLSTSEYEFFVNVMLSLKNAGYENITFKLHPGHNNVEYYKKICLEYGFQCKIATIGPFKDYVKWADVVIGPGYSGAMLEVISAGKMHLPVLLRPHPVDLSIFKNGTVYEDMASIGAVLASRDFPDQSGLLRDFCSLDDYENPAQNAWAIIEGSSSELYSATKQPAA